MRANLMRHLARWKGQTCLGFTSHNFELKSLSVQKLWSVETGVEAQQLLGFLRLLLLDSHFFLAVSSSSFFPMWLTINGKSTQSSDVCLRKVSLCFSSQSLLLDGLCCSRLSKIQSKCLMALPFIVWMWCTFFSRLSSSAQLDPDVLSRLFLSQPHSCSLFSWWLSPRSDQVECRPALY